ncbi:MULTISPECIES: metallophosphoesterase [unclassified Thermotoga]|uniref:metallophosphoesterase family protein n=1 Tax=unclassified Thermotoga TaxID=2631113 RepID=UPI000280E6F0|nr:MULTISPECIES: metallophosphoesterase family protein [unclassified Thermotoga]AIY86498.1 phosphodiesterase, MJ0936 family protein [Thermotoga sp. 2812B]EJX25939.1 phosphodiesterase, MJ0936 family protein [Thermotoga sp. EMP]
MRLAFFGDVHGNLEALKAVLEDMENKGVDEAFCLGDLVGYGPDPEAVVQTIMEKNIKTIMGNYDDAVGYSKESCGCSYAPGRETEVGDISLKWSIENTSEKTREFLRNLPKKLSFEVEGVRFLLVHGSPLNELLEYVKPNTPPDRLKKIVESVEEDVVVNGHTHLPMVKWVMGKLVLNPGSAGRPKDGDPRASYMIVDVENGTISFEIVRVKYDVKTTVEKIARNGLPVELATVLALGQTFDMGPGKVTFTLGR